MEDMTQFVTNDVIATDAVNATSIATGAVGAAELAADAVTTVKILNANVTPAKLSQPLTLGTAQNSTSGTSIDFTGIPNWVKRLTVVFNAVSTNGTNVPLIQLGTGGAPTTSGYVAGSAALAAASTTVATSTVGFPVFSNAASYALSGAITFVNVSGNLWVGSGSFNNVATTPYLVPAAGTVTLSGVLNMVRITSAGGTDTFDGGSINILYD